MITIVDYGMGNLRSVQKAFEKLGHEALITNHPDPIAKAEKIVLPGVGAFCDAMRELTQLGLVEPLRAAIDRGKPFLGICLGLQLLFEVSYEDGEHAGLGVIPGEVVRFSGMAHEYKVPHMGWNQLRIRRRPPLLAATAEGTHAYFVHSYYVVPSDEAVVAAETDYPRPFCSVVWRDNLMATQFHPEKSQEAGLAMLQEFAQM